MTLDINQLFPRFILKDKNGYALAKAIEAALNYAITKTQSGIDYVLDVSKMPEWRLDEKAQELNCLYDYSASIEKKRYWINNAISLYAAYGTKQAILNYLSGMFDAVTVEESTNFSFSVTVYGTLTSDNVSWLQKAVGTVKNVRSVYSGYALGALGKIQISDSGAVIAYGAPARAGALYAGDYEEL